MSCNHPQAAIYTGDEGTSFCQWCEDIGQAKVEARKNAMEEADKKLKEIVTLFRNPHAKEALRFAIEEIRRLAESPAKEER